jgi:hypothetical protein
MTYRRTITCAYRNETPGPQVVRIDESSEFYLERMVMPGQCLIFDALATASLQIHSYRMTSTIQEDTIPCQQLQHIPDISTVLSPKVLTK